MFTDLARLFDSPLRIKVVKFFALQPEQTFSTSALGPIVGATRDAVDAEVRALARAKILVSHKAKGGTQYGWNQEYTRASAVRAFLDSATIPDDKSIADFFRRITSVTTVIAAGVLVGEPRSSIDLLIVSRRPADKAIAEAVRRLEKTVALPLRFAVMGAEEFDERYRAYDRLIRDITDFRYKLLLGRI